jgi:hypothetical protein
MQTRNMVVLLSSSDSGPLTGMTWLCVCLSVPAGLPDEADIMAGITTDATGISSLQSGLETPDVALNLRKQGDSIVSQPAAFQHHNAYRCFACHLSPKPDLLLLCWTEF